ncbi:hypothetical protein CBR_g61510 [Chara braunii]|uniref:Uncharacterized protein n=1 Tax=Chara braunii TaxID=69332 RepID=A0A388K8W3_CHABU|nr:hypothetical protein CBR_g61510 [Chara braunii]|eukprot:GBG66467.1 hypothetical protein CBR_g61510 [Chara braunii]
MKGEGKTGVRSTAMVRNGGKVLANEVTTLAITDEEDRQPASNAVRMEVSMAVGRLEGQVCGKILQAIGTTAVRGKGKQQMASPSGSHSGSESEGSEVEEISKLTRKMAITEKRKRSAEKAIGNNPPMEQAAKQIPRTPGVRPVRLAVKLQTSNKKTKKTPNKYTPRRGAPKTKIAAMMGAARRAKFVRENVCQLAELPTDDLKEICRKEGVDYGNKTIATINIAEKRGKDAYDATTTRMTVEIVTQEDEEDTTISEDDESQGENLAA